MPQELRFVRNDHGLPRIDVPDELQVLKYALESDVSAQWGGELLSHIRDVERGKRTHWCGGGNVTTIDITRERARLEHDYVGELEMPLDEFKRAVEGWVRFQEPQIR